MLSEIAILLNRVSVINDKKHTVSNIISFMAVAVKLQHNVTRVKGDVRRCSTNSPITSCQI